MAGLPIIGNAFDDSDEKMMAELAKQKALIEAINLPSTDWESYVPEEYQSAGAYSPEQAKYELISEDPRLIQEQKNYLNKLKGLGEEGLSAEDKLGLEMASRSAASDAQARRGAALQSARARGVAGGGLEFALGEQANQSAADRQSLEGMQQAAQAARQRALYTQAYGGELGSQRQADFGRESMNKDIINRFNQLNSGQRNQAQMFNLQNMQNIMNQNVGGRNQAQMLNQGGKRDMAQQNYLNQLSKTGLQAGMYDQMAKAYAAEAEKNAARRKALGQGIGQGIGAMFGGPAGAAVGGGIGGGIGSL